MGRLITRSYTHPFRDGFIVTTTTPSIETPSNWRKRRSLDSSQQSGAIWRGKGDGKSHKGDGKKGTKGSKGQRVAWVTDINQGGQRHQLCMRFETGKCSMDNCRFNHLCAYPTRDGQACGKDHGALQHESTAH